MTEDERALLAETAKHVLQLFQDRDDLVVGVTAAILDLYREEFAAGRQIKEQALQRLTLEADAQRGKRGEQYLRWLIQTLKSGQLDAASLFRDHSAGSA